MRLLKPVMGCKICIDREFRIHIFLAVNKTFLSGLLSIGLSRITTKTGAALWNSTQASSSPAYSDDERWPATGSWPVSQPALLISPPSSELIGR